MTVKSESGDPVLSLKKYANYEDFSLSNFGEILHTRLFEFLEKGHNPTITGWREKKKIWVCYFLFNQIIKFQEHCIYLS